MLSRQIAEDRVTVCCSDGNFITKLFDYFILIEEDEEIKRLLGKTWNYLRRISSVGEIELYYGISHHVSAFVFQI